MKRAITAAAILAALAWSAPLAAQASDFTITVPVNVSGIPSNVTSVSVACDIMPEDYSDGTRQIAHGVASQPLSGGAFHGNVTVQANAAPGKDATLARYYHCRMSFLGSDRGRSVIYFLNGPSSPLVFPLAAGAPLNLGDAAHWIRIPGVAH
jgi:hypothetical protein